MGIATSTAIAIGTSVAAAGSSAVQASNAAGDAKRAKKDSADAFKRAMNELTSNKFKGLNLPTEARDREFDAMLSAGAQATQAATEGEGRGLAATAGRIQMAQQEGQRQIAGAMGEDLMKLEGLTAQEEANLSSKRANLELAQAEGAQAAAAQFGAQKDAAITGAFSSLANAGQQYMQGSELYKQSKEAKSFDSLLKEYEKAGKDGVLSKQFLDPKTNKPLPFNITLSKLIGDRGVASKVGSLTDANLQDYLIKNPDIMKSISGDAFSRGYDPGMDISASRIGLPQTRPSLNVNPFRN